MRTWEREREVEAHHGQFCAFFPTLSDFMLVVWNLPLWEYLYHRNQHTTLSFFLFSGESVVKYLLSHQWLILIQCTLLQLLPTSFHCYFLLTLRFFFISFSQHSLISASTMDKIIRCSRFSFKVLRWQRIIAVPARGNEQSEKQQHLLSTYSLPGTAVKIYLCLAPSLISLQLRDYYFQIPNFCNAGQFSLLLLHANLF